MAGLDKPVNWYQGRKARIAETEEDVAELETRGYTVVPDRDLPPDTEVVGEPFYHNLPDQAQPESIPLDPNLETPGGKPPFVPGPPPEEEV